MLSAASKKVRYILLSFKYISKDKQLNDEQKITLINSWISSCSKFEEYEMSQALLKVKQAIIRNRRLKNVGYRSFIQIIILYCKIIFRKLKR